MLGEGSVLGGDRRQLPGGTGPLVQSQQAGGVMVPETSYYGRPGLTVTSATLTHKSTTVPVSAIASVSVQRISGAKTRWYLQGAGIGVVAAAFGVGMFALANRPGPQLIPVPAWWGVLGPLISILGVAALGIAVVALAQSIGRRNVVVGLLSGSALSIWATVADADEIKQAIDRAVTCREIGGHGPSSTADELEKLAALRNSGVLSSEEWDRAKDLYLGKPPDARAAALEHLRGLFQLHRDGVLSLSEFNTKKWEVLSKRE